MTHGKSTMVQLTLVCGNLFCSGTVKDLLTVRYESVSLGSNQVFMEYLT